MEKHIITVFERYGREPILRRMPDGTLVCLFLTGGGREPGNDNVVMISRSNDDGSTWTAPETLFSHSRRGCWSTELCTEAAVPFAIVQTYNAECHYRELTTHVSYTYDNGKTWTEPVSLPGSCSGCSIRQGFRMSNEEMLFPLYWQECREGFDFTNICWGTEKWLFVTGVGISSDSRHFFRHGYLSVEGVHLWEPNAIEVNPGHILLYCRTSTGFLYRSESTDYGRTWTTPEKTDIPNPDTKLTLLRAGGKILLVNNFTSRSGMENRTHLSIGVSEAGKQFRQILNVEAPDEAWFYPHGFADDCKRTLYLTYENSKEHRFAKISYDELGI